MVKKFQKNLYLKSLISPNIDQTYTLKTFLETMRDGQYEKQKNWFLNICVQVFLTEYGYFPLTELGAKVWVTQLSLSVNLTECSVFITGNITHLWYKFR